MRYYRCKCGERQSWGSMPPYPCQKCPACGSDLAESPDLHREPQDHDWRTQQVETDNGPQPITRCSWCGTRKPAMDAAALQKQVDAWNATWIIGTHVEVKEDCGQILLTRTRTAASVENGEAVVAVAFVHDRKYPLSRVRPVGGVNQRPVKKTVGGQLIIDGEPLLHESLGASDYCHHCGADMCNQPGGVNGTCPTLERVRHEQP